MFILLVKKVKISIIIDSNIKKLMKPYLLQNEELKELESFTPTEQEEYKNYYSRLTDVVRRYLEEEAKITALESTTDELLLKLEALKKSGKDKNTYIFFTGDHGLSVGRHGLLGKQNMFDHSIRVPLLMVGPDIPKKHKIDQEVYLQDIMATSLELANIDQPDDIEFNSLLSTVKGTSQVKIYKNGIYGAYIDYQRMIRKDGFKLIVYPKIKKTVLFDLKNDPKAI